MHKRVLLLKCNLGHHDQSPALHSFSDSIPKGIPLVPAPDQTLPLIFCTFYSIVIYQCYSYTLSSGMSKDCKFYQRMHIRTLLHTEPQVMTTKLKNLSSTYKTRKYKTVGVRKRL